MIDIKCGNCIDLLDTISDGSVDLILTDPPYNISIKNNNRDRSNLSSPIMRRNKPVNYDFGSWDNMERQEFLDFTYDWFGKCANKLRDGGTFISFFNKEDISYLSWIGKEFDIRTRTIFTWHKTNPVPSFRKVNYLSSCEFAFIGSKGDGAWTFNFGLQKEMHNFYETPNSSSYKVTEHPTEKPLKFMEHLLNIHSNVGDVVLDPFMGSGTTAVAAKNLNRNFIGFEQDEKYFNIAKSRLDGTYMKTAQSENNNCDNNRINIWED